MENTVLNIYKPLGWTPFQVIKKLKEKNDFSDLKMSYAGKLDPMAEGVLLVLTGDETSNQQNYQNLNKEYVAEIVLGCSTDSFDILGMIEDKSDDFSISKAEVDESLDYLKGNLNIKIPAFSSFEINGQPLFKWAREDKLDQIDIPKKKMSVFENSLMEFTNIKKDKLKEEIESRINKVDGDFRQEDILEKWDDFFENTSLSEFPLIRVKFQCSSGTYIRSLVNEFAKITGTPAFLFSLARTKVGLPDVDDDIFWAGDSIKLGDN